MDLGSRLNLPGVLFPTSDAFVLLLSRRREELARHYLFRLAPPDVLESLINKRGTYEMAERIGICYPTTYFPGNLDEVHRIKHKLSYPAIVKPYYGHLWSRSFPGIKGFKVVNPTELLATFERLLPTGHAVLVQSVILGPNTNHFKVCGYLDDRGDPLALFALRKIRQYPTEFGVGTVVDSIHDPALIDLGLRFFQEIGFCGIGSIEFKRDDRDGKTKLIEFNPRLWQQNAHAEICGINFPLILYNDVTGSKPTLQDQYPAGVRYVDAFGDLHAFASYFRRGQLMPWTWLASLWGAKAYASYARDDLTPFWKSTITQTVQILSGVTHKLFGRRAYPAEPKSPDPC